MYRWRTGMWAYVLQRVSGIALGLYICMHVYVTHLLVRGPGAFDRAMAVLANPFFKLGEVALLAAVLFHGLNGVRLLVVDTGWGVKRHKPLFWGMAAAFVVLLVAGGIPLLPKEF